MSVVCSCPNPQSCTCRASPPEPTRRQEYPSGYQRSFPPFQTPSWSQAHTGTTISSSYSPFTPRSRGPPTQHRYAGAYSSYVSYDQNHAIPSRNHNDPRIWNTYPNSSPHRTILHRTPTRPHGSQRYPDYPPAPPPRPLIPPVVYQPTASAETRGTKRKSTNATVPKRAKHSRVPAPLDTGPVAAGCGVSPSASNNGFAPATSSPLVFPGAGPSASRSSSTSLPTASYASLSKNRRPTKQSAAKDCWYPFRAADSDVQPLDTPSAIQTASDPSLQPLTEKPRTSHISCKLCR